MVLVWLYVCAAQRYGKWLNVLPNTSEGVTGISAFQCYAYPIPSIASHLLAPPFLHDTVLCRIPICTQIYMFWYLSIIHIEQGNPMP